MSRSFFENGNTPSVLWGLFLILVLSAMFIAVGYPMQPIIALGLVVSLIFAYRSIYFTMYLGFALMPILGALVSISTGGLLFGQRAFGGSLDVSIAEVVLFFALFAWALKLILLWQRRRDPNWLPRLPLWSSYAALVGAHFASMFSRLQPDPYLVAKFSLRPVLFNYLAFIALPVNLIRSRRRLVAASSALALVGVFAALVGFISIFFPYGGAGIGRAHPLSLFGVSPLGENQNELADLLVFTAPMTFALAYLIHLKSKNLVRLVAYAGAFQSLIGLLTFTRTIWIVFGLELVVLGTTMWRESIKRHAQELAIVAFALLPLAIGMGFYAASDTAKSSNSTRIMLSQIAYELFLTSPVVGSGAGTFYDRVGSTSIFFLEYGAPLDSHGFIQKIAAETGLIGLFALTFVMMQCAYLLYVAWKAIRLSPWKEPYLLFVAAAAGSFVYQLFNTDYWTGKLWLPIGLALAAGCVLRKSERKEPEVV